MRYTPSDEWKALVRKAVDRFIGRLHEENKDRHWVGSLDVVLLPTRRDEEMRIPRAVVFDRSIQSEQVPARIAIARDGRALDGARDRQEMHETLILVEVLYADAH